MPGSAPEWTDFWGFFDIEIIEGDFWFVTDGLWGRDIRSPLP